MAAADDLRFHELGPPLPPAVETFDHVVGAAVGVTTHLRVQLGDVSRPVVPRITLVRRDNPTKAYAEIVRPGWPKSLGRAGRGLDWGQVQLAVVYPKVPNTEDTFESPASIECAQFVIIKRISKVALRSYELRGGRENPRKEVARMLELGDDVHVLRLDDFLEDDEWLYIITPKGESLLDWFSARQGEVNPEQASAFFRKIIQILRYFRANNVCHHDVSPDNFLFLPNGELVAFDLALSIRLRLDETLGIRHQVFEPNALYGTPSMMSPEVAAVRPYDGLQLDVWGAVCIYACLLIGFPPFSRPEVNDPLFRVFALSRGFADIERIEDALAFLDETEILQMPILQRMIRAWNVTITLTPDQRQLLANSFEVDPNGRMSLAELLMHPI
jgi:serine/threonine protein kinase